MDQSHIIEQEILKWGGIAGALAAALGLGAKIISKARKFIQLRNEKKNEFQKVLMKEIEGIRQDVNSVKTEIGDIKTEVSRSRDDIGKLQRNELIRAYNGVMEAGYCPLSEKNRILHMYDEYCADGRDSLVESFKPDIQKLSLFPPKINTEDLLKKVV